MPEKLQTLLIILVGVIIFVVRMVRKAQETMRREAQERKLPQPGEQRGPARPVRPPGAPSFDDLLQQMMEQNRRGQAAPETTPAGRPAPREPHAPARSLETTVQRPARSLEETAVSRPARSLEAPAVTQARLAATLPRAAVAHGTEDYWSRQAASLAPRTSTAANVAARLRNPEDIRAAFILAEVLQRRY